MTGMLSGMLVLFVSSCVKDDFDRYHDVSDALSFKVEVSDGWSEAASASSTTSIRRMSQSTDAEPLYLVTMVSDSAPVSAESGVVTRGTPVENADPMKTGGFGLSAICYTGTWPAEGSTNSWTTNFAHNLNVTMQDGKWKAPGKLEWPGSGNIKFFAYYPYSGNSDGCITHSGADAKGAPVLTYTVPEDVKKQPDLLWAVADHSGKSTGDGSVALNFQHALTAVTIKTGSDMLSGTITGVKISGVYGKGSCRIGGTTWTTQGETRDFEITDLSVALSKKTDENGIGINTTPGTTVTDGEFTFMMVPQPLTDEAELTIYFKDDLTKIDRTLTAKIGGNGASWPAGKKVAYSINSTGIVIEPVLEMTVNRDGQWPAGGYELSDNMITAANMYGAAMTDAQKTAYLPVSGYLHDVDITAYVKVTQASADNEEDKERYLELPFEIEYSVEGGSDWKTGSWIPDEAAGEARAAVPKKGGILLEAQSQFTELQKYFKEGYDGGHSWLAPTTRTTLTEQGKGSKAEPYDLVAENPIAPGESANCYIINDHGYYRFPVCYGNTYGTGISSYKATESSEGKDYQLLEFVGYNNEPITSTGTVENNGAVWINNVTDAVILWQDSPDLVEDVKLQQINGQNWVSFHTAKPALSQGNAVIAVRNEAGTILWSWHIWATHYNWQDKTAMIPSGAKREDDVDYELTPCNLGYCEPHGADGKRTISMRIKVTLPDGNQKVMKPAIKDDGCPAPDTDGVIAFTQPAIAESVAGDNTYYQWGRKDPMLPGVFDADVYKRGLGTFSQLDAKKNELTMNNKMFYSTKQYRVFSDDTGKSIGDAIQTPHIFFIHKRPKSDGKENGTAEQQEDFKNNMSRRHWHDGTKVYYQKHALMNYWNTQLDKVNVEDTKATPNGIYVAKTIYDPSPAGYKVPSPNAYTGYYTGNALQRLLQTDEKVQDKGVQIGWELTAGGQKIFYPATGVRDIGLQNRDHTWGTFPAFADVTFITTAGFVNGAGASRYSLALFSIDNRGTNYNIRSNYGTSNSYGLSLRPVLDKDK